MSHFHVCVSPFLLNENDGKYLMGFACAIHLFHAPRSILFKMQKSFQLFIIHPHALLRRPAFAFQLSNCFPLCTRFNNPTAMNNVPIVIPQQQLITERGTSISGKSQTKNPSLHYLLFRMLRSHFHPTDYVNLYLLQSFFAYWIFVVSYVNVSLGIIEQEKQKWLQVIRRWLPSAANFFYVPLKSYL